VHKFKRDNGLEYKPANIVVSTGAKQSLYNVCQVMLNPVRMAILPVLHCSYARNGKNG
jgi:aspartate aminotransferase